MCLKSCPSISQCPDHLLAIVDLHAAPNRLVGVTGEVYLPHTPEIEMHTCESTFTLNPSVELLCRHSEATATSSPHIGCGLSEARDWSSQVCIAQVGNISLSMPHAPTLNEA